MTIPLSPLELKTLFFASEKMHQQVAFYRQQIADILFYRDSRLLLVVGPCSIHNPEEALDYAIQLKKIAQKVENHVFIVMRTYFEKPRTAGGWPGFLQDPCLNGQLDIERGLRLSRELLLEINRIGLPTATEWLDTITPSYLGDLISWSAIGARTTESQLHRQLASGLSMPVGFKNTTSGNYQAAIEAIKVIQNSQAFFTVNDKGQLVFAETKGNPLGHLVLRGSVEAGPNYSKEYLVQVKKIMEEKKINARVLIDCSHGNSGKDERRQSFVFQDVFQQICHGETIIAGMMLESYLKSGKQNNTPKPLQYGVSVTDACINLFETETLIEQLAEWVKTNRENKVLECVNGQ